VACESAGLALLLVPALEGGTENLTLVGQAAVDGFVVYSMPEESPHLDAALRRNLPLVIVDEPDGLGDPDWIGLDDESSFTQIGRHLLTLGHRRVGIVCSRLSPGGHDAPVSADRLGRATYSVQRNRINGLPRPCTVPSYRTTTCRSRSGTRTTSRRAPPPGTLCSPAGPTSRPSCARPTSLPWVCSAPRANEVSPFLRSCRSQDTTTSPRPQRQG
jgi:DNA-binding LacI/PurR family transcriptional regulator